MKKTTFLAIALLFASLSIYAQSTATYTVTFDSNWSQSAHPHSSGNIPSSAHWSKLVGATHNDQIVFLEMGGLATPGIEDVAELGSNNVFQGEVNTAITNGTANQYINGPSLSTGLGQIVLDELVTTSDYPLLSLISMIAPSPDWVVAINSVPLIDGSGEWIQTINIDLYPYDAGTDSGTDYTSGDVNTNPAETISSLQGIAPFSNEVMGTLTIELQSVLGVDDDSQANALQLFPNPTDGNLTINTRERMDSIEIYNVIGRKVKTLRPNSNRMETSISDLANGIYLVRITTDNGAEITKKLIKR